MCNATNCNHAPVADTLDDYDAFLADFGLEARPEGMVVANDERPALTDAMHYEPCRKCKGTGRFIGWSGRALGPCFTCKGAGKQAFKTAAPVRAAARQQAAARKAAVAQVWIDANKAEFDYMTKRGFKSAFYAELCKKVFDYGELTERQLAAARSDMAKDAERVEAVATRLATAKVVDISKIETVFQRAIDNQVARPKLRLDAFVFSLVVNGGANHGAVYVKLPVDGDEDTYLGKIKDGKFLRSRDCTPQQEETIVAVASNPAEAAKAYGQREGRCSICARKLTKNDSIDRFMGPICAEKYGF